ncbi:ABC transporter substrate-binding protein [Ancylobacter terrae]|uniref:ABC transporter substrate-binding protein n=1 Tax=Ancylobacter sp. sgz301288 TaxID=3342077 RepID=UPI0038590096
MVVLAALNFTVALMTSPPADSASAPILRVGGVLDTKPWEFRNETNQVVGFEVDLANRIGDRLGMRVEFVGVTNRDLFEAVDQQRVDMAMNAIVLTEQRASRYEVTQPYYDFSRGLVVQKKSGLRGLADMARKVVAVEAGSGNEVWLDANKLRYGFAVIQKVSRPDEGLDQLSRGAVDGFVADMPLLLHEAGKRSDLAIVTRIPTTDRFVGVLRKNSPLVDKVDDAITQMKKDGTLAQIHRDWFGLLPDKSSATVKPLPRP